MADFLGGVEGCDQEGCYVVFESFVEEARKFVRAGAFVELDLGDDFKNLVKGDVTFTAVTSGIMMSMES